MEEIHQMLLNLQQDIKQQKQDMLDMKEDLKNIIINNIHEKFANLELKNEQLEKTIEEQKVKLNNLERHSRRKNLVMFGVEESENTYFELENIIVNIINNFFEFQCDKNNIELVRRLGKKGDNIRPVVITFNSMSYKINILKKKSCLENTQYYIKEDYPIEVLNRRKELQVQLQKEKEKGYTAFIRYDKLIVLKGTFEKENPTKKVLETRKQLQPKAEEEWKKGNKSFLRGDQLVIKKLQDNQREKRKRDKTVSPNLSTQKKQNTSNKFENTSTKTNNVGQKEILQPNILQYIGRDRSFSTSDISKTNKHTQATYQNKNNNN
ncbi:SUN domain-containing protein 2-like [Pieris napi]|uniref:SUN domain-containing protein 2-like n=1 Tax=Pieris napi TaxID=78633 RepID=UPI001FBA7532|nr:SUN domain-containing protein 2-like [Pieris napi]